MGECVGMSRVIVYIEKEMGERKGMIVGLLRKNLRLTEDGFDMFVRFI